MAIKTTRWSPDTCGCTVDYTWDDTVPAVSRVHTPAAVVVRCAQHTGHTDAETHAALHEENPRKNKAEARLLAAFPGVLGTTDAQGNVSIRPDAYTYAFNGPKGARTLSLVLPLLNGTQRTAVQTWCDNNLGAGKVTVS